MLNPAKRDEYQRLLDERSEMRRRLDGLPYHEEQTEEQKARFELWRDRLAEVTEELIQLGVMEDSSFMTREALELGLNIGWY